MIDQLIRIEEKYQCGIDLLKERGYYDQIFWEIQWLVKYLDDRLFLFLLSDNLFADIQGVFSTFIRIDLKKIFDELVSDPGKNWEDFLQEENTNLMVLHKCATNIQYHIKSIVRMPQIRNLTFKSRYLGNISRKFSGEVQQNYKLLLDNYKIYFRKKFTTKVGTGDNISLPCLQELVRDYDLYFGTTLEAFQQLSEAIHFVRELFQWHLETRIRRKIEPIFNGQDKFNKIIEYFISDLKRDFIQIMVVHQKKGKKFPWIEKVALEFLRSERFDILLRKVIFQTFSIRQKKTSSQPDQVMIN